MNTDGSCLFFAPRPTPLRAPITRVLLWITMVLIAPVTYADDLREPIDGREIRLTLPINGGHASGRLVGYSPMLFVIETESGDRHRILWNEIPAVNVDRYWRYLEQPEANAKKLLELGVLLHRHSQGKELAASAFDAALTLDASLADRIDALKAQPASDASPRFLGSADLTRWGPQTNEAMQAGATSLHVFCDKSVARLGVDLKRYESKRFLLLTDVDPKKLQPLITKLMQTYRETAEVLGEDPDGNVFYGKCLVVLLDRRVDYVRFVDTMYGSDARGTGGLCHGLGNGQAHIALIERASDAQTHHVAAHELVHAYLHRYQSPMPVPDWVSEGLAEHIAHKISPPPGSNLSMKARLALEGQKKLGEGFFDGGRLKAWQYDVAGALTGYQLTLGDRAYPRFMQQIKKSTDAQEAMQDVYRVTPAKLVQRFKRRLDRDLSDRLGG